mmetsp:Transcript_22277/g.63272  ORF Transcript_22277/g.63272 Transcript_22277/m.63272 type:complete len:212 (-) Transcript_22277:19-654(-)
MTRPPVRAARLSAHSQFSRASSGCTTASCAPAATMSAEFASGSKQRTPSDNSSPLVALRAVLSGSHETWWPSASTQASCDSHRFSRVEMTWTRLAASSSARILAALLRASGGSRTASVTAWWLRSARSAGVAPRRLRIARSAPATRSRRTTSACPPPAARWRGVSPCVSRAPGLAFFAKSFWQFAMSPSAAARWRGCLDGEGGLWSRVMNP